MNTNQELDVTALAAEKPSLTGQLSYYYRVRFRDNGQEITVNAELASLNRSDLAMVLTDHGLEPAMVYSRLLNMVEQPEPRPAVLSIQRLANEEERQQFQLLLSQETEAFLFCKEQVEELKLIMHLVRVERFFNGSKIIFYFTAENRVDFRQLVKDLVQEYHTRIEMRQIGVRHETQMLGGMGICGRQLCCSSFLQKFDSVSIKMAKAQDLPLNPAKISGACNRLLCCLTYEYENYRDTKKRMPRMGRSFQLHGEEVLVVQQHPLSGAVTVTTTQGERKMVPQQEWEQVHQLAQTGTRSKSKEKNEGEAEPAKQRPGKVAKKKNEGEEQ